MPSAAMPPQSRASLLNWVVVGIGDITKKRVMPAIAAEPRSRLYGVVSRDPEKGRAYAPQVWTTLEQALEDPAAEAVYVATPVALHAPQSIAALRAGRHVLCEKPLAMNYSEACAMVRAAEEAGVQFGVAYYRRFYPKLLRARELLRAASVGRPLLAEIRCHDWFENRDGFRSWLLDPALAGGGPLYDIASHRIDV
ncbi:MAG TPA: Gfo/Idh/MocA family oxidoreductase, partial [Bryobacterales bacterium]|nr:Gfo/Idh/MocA family oxidoreductase [Bryobacterales bacterium]